MYISYNWLRELTGTVFTPAELRERLTMVGLAIDAVEERGGDYVLDVEVPSNRPDCLSHVGIAREVAVIEGGQIIFPRANPPKTAGLTESLTAVEILDPDLCPRYAARIVRGVNIAPSPAWLAEQLEEIGQRPINNVADITNYVLHELGQPLHAFDLAKLTEQRIFVRRARPGEKLKTLDGVERELDREMLVIADAERAVAVAGVMGGEDSEISQQTVDVLIESAYFNPDSVRRTARRLGMDTEASRRFERGADYGGVIRAQERCVELICELAAGVATEGAIDVCGELPPARRVSFRPARVAELTSLQVSSGEMLRILTGLGFEQTEFSSQRSGDRDSLSFNVPTWRVDVEREEDLVEEIARHTGYDKIASELPPSSFAGEYQPAEMKRRTLRRALALAGFDEAIDFSFIDTACDQQITLIPSFASAQGLERFVALKNPIIEDAVRMRPSLLPGLLNSLRHNFNHGKKDVRLFEIGRIFAGFEPGALPAEREALAFVATGGATEEGHAEAPGEIDFFAVKGAFETAVEATRLGPLRFRSASAKHLREGQTAAIELSDGLTIGTLGRLAETIAAPFKFRQPVYLGEVDLTALLGAEERSVQYRPLPRYPSVIRDVTLLVQRDVTFAALAGSVYDQRVAACRSVRLVGVYQGPNIPEDKRSITLRLEYRADDRTLRDDEVEEIHRKIVDSVAQKFAAELH